VLSGVCEAYTAREGSHTHSVLSNPVVEQANPISAGLEGREILTIVISGVHVCGVSMITQSARVGGSEEKGLEAQRRRGWRLKGEGFGGSKEKGLEAQRRRVWKLKGEVGAVLSSQAPTWSSLTPEIPAKGRDT
jgi:hypothetical protein